MASRQDMDVEIDDMYRRGEDEAMSKEADHHRVSHVLWLTSDDPKAKEKRIMYFSCFLRWHRIAALVLLSAVIAFVVAAACGSFPTKVFVTSSTLRDNPTPPPDLYNRYHIVNESHLAWFVFILAIMAVYHLALGLPGAIVNPFVICNRYRDELGEYTDGMRTSDFENQEEAESTNYLFIDWFYNNLLYGASGIKRIPYGLSSALFVVLVAQLVGVTDIALLSSFFIFTFFGFVIIWSMEKAHMSYFKNASGNIAAREGGKKSSSRQNRNKDDNYLIAKTEEFMEIVDEIIRDIAKFDQTSIHFASALVMVAIPFITIIAYFGVGVSENSGGFYWFVYLAFSYYVAYQVINFVLLWMYHHNYAFASDYMLLDLVLDIVHTIFVASITCFAIAIPHNEEFLYGIEAS